MAARGVVRISAVANEPKLLNGLEEAILARRSIRQFVSTPVPRTLLIEALSIARHAPSNSNIQPWQVYIVEGDRRDRLREELLLARKRAPPVPKPIPAEYTRLRQELGAVVYGAMGIQRGDNEAREAAQLRNWEFFGAPVVAMVCLHEELGMADAVSVGMFVQTLLLELTARGLGSCCQAALSYYPDVIRKELDIPPKFNILCGVAIGYADETFTANYAPVGRAPMEHNIKFLDS